jgi:hypothetical protein
MLTPPVIPLEMTSPASISWVGEGKGAGIVSIGVVIDTVETCVLVGIAGTWSDNCGGAAIPIGDATGCNDMAEVGDEAAGKVYAANGSGTICGGPPGSAYGLKRCCGRLWLWFGCGWWAG